MWCAIKHVCVLKYLGHYLISIFWQIRNNKNPNSYHRHKGCAWFVSDLLRWRVSSCNVWIFPVVNNITSVLQYFPSNYLFCSYWRNNILLFLFPTCTHWRGRLWRWAHCSSCPPCSPPRPSPGGKINNTTTCYSIMIILSLSINVHPRFSAFTQQWDFNWRHSWYYQQRHHCYVQGKTHLDIINTKTLSQSSRMIKASETFERLLLYASAGNIIRHNQTLSYCSRLVRPSRGCSCRPRQAEALPAGPAPGCWGAAPGRRPGHVELSFIPWQEKYQ